MIESQISDLTPAYADTMFEIIDQTRSTVVTRVTSNLQFSPGESGR